MSSFEIAKMYFLRAIYLLAKYNPALAVKFLVAYAPLLRMNKKGMAPVVSLFLGLGTVIIVALVSILLSGVVSGQMSTLFTTFNVSATWTTIATNIENIISSAYSIGGLGILVFARTRK